MVAYGVARLYLRTIIKAQGVQCQIVSDRDTFLELGAWSLELTASFGTSLVRSTAYHSTTDGQTERTNKTLDEMLRHLDLPEALRIHDVFHVPLLRPYASEGKVQLPPSVSLRNRLRLTGS